MSLYLFSRFHALPGREKVLGEALLEVVRLSRDEPGCLEIHAYHSVRDPLEFYIHSHWTDRAAFDQHAELPHMVSFLGQVPSLIDHEFKATLAERIFGSR